MIDSPQLIASFVLEDGRPVYDEGDGHRHYRIIFELQNVPTDVFAATYELHPSYWDPTRAVKRTEDGRFRLETTSYGDYRVKVRLRSREGFTYVVDKVSTALRRTANVNDASQAEAVSYIEKH